MNSTGWMPVSEIAEFALHPERYSPGPAGAYFLEWIIQTIAMFLSFTAGLTDSINNFLKNEAEIVADFKIHLQRSVQELDQLQQSVHSTYNRVLQSLQQSNGNGLSGPANLYMEENY